MKTAVTMEGSTRLVVPSESLLRSPPPTSPVFFNPAASLNRDVSVAVVAAIGGSTFCDSLAGVGSRGVRVAKEAGLTATAVDFNGEALRLARRSASLNRVAGRCKFVKSEANAFLSSRYGKDERYDFVDADPFGSPAPFVTSAVRATTPGGVTSFTATDAAALCGVYPSVSARRYLARSMNNHFNHETGVRILLGAIARLAGSLDVGTVPVFAHATRHYFRVYVRVRPGAMEADASVAQLGYIVWGHRCGHVEASKETSTVCPACGEAAKCAGPLWLGKVTDEKVVAAAAEQAARRGLAKASKLISGFAGVGRLPPWSYSLEGISSSLGVPTVSRGTVSQILEGRGFRTGGQPFEKEGLKTDAGYDEVFRAAKDSIGVSQAPEARARGLSQK